MRCSGCSARRAPTGSHPPHSLSTGMGRNRATSRCTAPRRSGGGGRRAPSRFAPALTRARRQRLRRAQRVRRSRARARMRRRTGLRARRPDRRCGLRAGRSGRRRSGLRVGMQSGRLPQTAARRVPRRSGAPTRCALPPSARLRPPQTAQVSAPRRGPRRLTRTAGSPRFRCASSSAISRRGCRAAPSRRTASLSTHPLSRVSSVPPCSTGDAPRCPASSQAAAG